MPRAKTETKTKEAPKLEITMKSTYVVHCGDMPRLSMFDCLELGNIGGNLHSLLNYNPPDTLSESPQWKNCKVLFQTPHPLRAVVYWERIMFLAFRDSVVTEELSFDDQLLLFTALKASRACYPTQENVDLLDKEGKIIGGDAFPFYITRLKYSEV